jgi:hypothetical protein
MIFSTSARHLWLDRDIDSNETELHVEFQTDNRSYWHLSSVTLENVLGITEGCKGFDTREDNSASNQGYTLQPRFVPGSLTLYAGSVLRGKL